MQSYNSINPTINTNEYTFCPNCGVDTTIFSHEDDCPCVRHTKVDEALNASKK